MKKQYKTGESQRRAIKAYQERNKGMYKTISITLPSAEAEQSRQIIKEHNTTPAKVWREAMERLNAEPIPTEQHADTPRTDKPTDPAGTTSEE